MSEAEATRPEIETNAHRAAEAGEEFEGQFSSYTIAERCKDPTVTGEWSCLPHKMKFAVDKHRLSMPGAHVVCWACHKHGAEAGEGYEKDLT